MILILSTIKPTYIREAITIKREKIKGDCSNLIFNIDLLEKTY